MSSTSDLYEFKMSLFDYGNPEEFLLFVTTFNTNLVVTGILEMNINTPYLRTLLCGEEFRNFDLLSVDQKIQRS